MERLYTGPQADSELVEHMRACNAKGPLVVQIAKLFPKSDCSAFDAFGRVYSGTVRPGDKVPPCIVSTLPASRTQAENVPLMGSAVQTCQTCLASLLSTLLWTANLACLHFRMSAHPV